MLTRIASLPGGTTVLAMTTVMALDTSDQSAIGATAPEVREAFGIGQTQIGLLATSSTLIGALATLPFGVLADRTNRVRLLRTTVVAWTVAVAAVAAAPNFALMLVAHGVLGLVTGAGGPLIASAVGDLVPPVQRGRVFSALLLGELIGSAFGLSVCGEIAAIAGWRWAYVTLAIVGALVLVLLARAREPNRTLESGTARGAVGMADALRRLVRNRTLVLLVLASALGYYFFAGVQTFAVSLLRTDYGASAALAPMLVLLVSLCLAVGVVIGGRAGDRLLHRRPGRGRLPLLVIAFAGSLVFIVPALIAHTLPVTIPLLMGGGILLGAANPSLDATRIDIVSARLRGRAEALRTAAKDGADASAPVLFGVTGAAIGLRPTFVVMTVTLVAAFVLCALATLTYPRDAPLMTAATRPVADVTHT